LKADKDHILELADKIGLLEYFEPPKRKHESWKKHDLAAFLLHELGHLAMGHLEPNLWGHLKGVMENNKLITQYEFTKNELWNFAEVLLQIPYQPDEWSVQAWCCDVSRKHGWCNTDGNQWQTGSPSRKLRETVFLHTKDHIGLRRSGVDIVNDIYCPTYTHLQIKKTRVFICAGDNILDEADITKITDHVSTIILFSRVKSLKLMLAKRNEACSYESPDNKLIQIQNLK